MQSFKPNFLLAILLLLVSTIAYGQKEKSVMYETIDSTNKQKFFKLTKPGNKVYIAAGTPSLALHAADILTDAGYHWKIVDKPDKADFILYLDDSRIFVSELEVNAVYIEPQSREPFYQTHSVNTIGRISFHARKGAIKKLIDKRIIYRLNELDERDTEIVYRCNNMFDGKFHFKKNCPKMAECNKTHEITHKAALNDYSPCKECSGSDKSKYKNL